MSVELFLGVFLGAAAGFFGGMLYEFRRGFKPAKPKPKPRTRRTRKTLPRPRPVKPDVVLPEGKRVDAFFDKGA